MATCVARFSPLAPIILMYAQDMGKMAAEPYGAALTTPKGPLKIFNCNCLDLDFCDKMRCALTCTFAHVESSASLHHWMRGQEGSQMCFDSNRSYSRASSAMGNAKGFV